MEKWIIADYDDYENTTDITNKDGMKVCTVDFGTDKDEKNLHLIASAPEMYNQLLYLSSLMPYIDEQTHPQFEFDAIKSNIDRLLAKARGEK